MRSSGPDMAEICARARLAVGYRARYLTVIRRENFTPLIYYRNICNCAILPNIAHHHSYVTSLPNYSLGPRNCYDSCSRLTMVLFDPLTPSKYLSDYNLC